MLRPMLGPMYIALYWWSDLIKFEQNSFVSALHDIRARIHMPIIKNTIVMSMLVTFSVRFVMSTLSY